MRFVDPGAGRTARPRTRRHVQQRADRPDCASHKVSESLIGPGSHLVNADASTLKNHTPVHGTTIRVSGKRNRASRDSDLSGTFVESNVIGAQWIEAPCDALVVNNRRIRVEGVFSQRL